MTPDELIKEEKELEEDRKVYPPFLVEQFRNGRERRRKNLPQSFSKITDFTQVLRTTWVISSKAYQKEFWNKHGQWGDNFGETMETFLGDAEGVLEATDDEEIEMIIKQREMLQKLYDRLDFFTRDPETPGSDYGENDEAIINDPKWQEIGKYAKLVYEELSGDDLDAWEKSRVNGG